MQNVRNASGKLSDLAQVIAVPADNKPHRLPGFPALEKTSVLAFKNVRLAGVGSSDGSAPQAVAVSICRSPTFPCWSTRAVTQASSSYWDHELSRNFTLAPGDDYDFPEISLTNANYRGWGDFTDSDVSANPVGHHGGRLFYYGPHNLFRTLEAVGSATATTAITLIIETWGPNGCARSHMNTNFGGTASYAAFAAIGSSDARGQGYWRPVRLMNVGTGTITFSAWRIGYCTGGNLLTPSYPAATTVYCPIGKPPDFDEAKAPWRSVRATAAAVLCQNVTAVLNKEGTINAARMLHTKDPSATSTPNFFNPTMQMLSNVHPDDRYIGPMEKGLYMYAAPDETSDEFCDGAWSNQTNTLGVSVPLFSLDQLSYFTAAIFTDLDPATKTTIQLVNDWHIEFRTSSVLFPRQASQYSLEAYHGAQMALAKMGCIFENPTHLREIARMAIRAASAVAPLVMPLVKNAVKARLPLAVPLVQAAAKMIKASQQKKKKQQSKRRPRGKRSPA